MAPEDSERGQSSAEYTVGILVLIVVISALVSLWSGFGPAAGDRSPAASLMVSAPYTVTTSTLARPQWLFDLAVH